MELEYKIEYAIKPLKAYTNDAFPTVDDFKKAAHSAKVVEVSPDMDSKIGYRSHTKSKAQLISLIKGYASYPQFRNEKTIEHLYDSMKNNNPMTMAIVLKFKDGKMRVMGDNTRMDVAFQLGIKPKVLMIDVPSK